MRVCAPVVLGMRSILVVSSVLVAVAFGFAPGPASAQDGSHWGVGASVTPQWKSMEKPLELFWGLGGTGTLEGTEFTIGIVRGSTRGGDWGVNFVNKSTKDGEPIVDVGDCEPQPCTGSTTTTRLRNVKHTGVEFVWSPMFVTIANRAQIGIAVGGGIANTKGDMEQTLNIFGFQDTFVGPATEVLYKKVPLIRFEVQGGIIVAPGLKVKLSGGFNSPGTAIFRIGAVYLIGAE